MTDSGRSEGAGQGSTSVGQGDSKSGVFKLVEQEMVPTVKDCVGYECAFAKAGRVSIGLHHQGASYFNRIQWEVSVAEYEAERKRVDEACQSDYLGHPDGVGFNSDGTLSLEGKEKPYGKAFGSGDVETLRVRFDHGELQFAVNGAWQGVALKGVHSANFAVGLLCEGDAAETLSFRELRKGCDT